MNLEWIKSINDELLLKRKALEDYYNNRNHYLMDALDQSKLVKQQAIQTAKQVMNKLNRKENI